MTCFQLCVASPQLSFQTDRNWRESHLKENITVTIVAQRMYVSFYVFAY